MVYLTYAIIGLGRRGVIKTWTEVDARVRLYMLTSDLTSLVPPKFSHWLQVRKVGTVIFYYYYYLIIYFYGLDPTMILRINIPKINRLIQYLFDFCSKSFTFSMRYSSNELIQKTVLTRGTNSCNYSLNCLLPGVTTKWITSTVEDLSSSLFQSAKRNNGGYRTRA